MNNPNWQVINRNNDVFQIILALKNNRKKRSEYNEVFIEGIESIKQAITSNRVQLQKVLFSDYKSLSQWSKDLISQKPFKEIIQLNSHLYNELSDKNEPSELMITIKYKQLVLSDINLPKNPFIVIFDRPSDFGNLGSLIRSANALGVDLFITHGHCVDYLESKVIRSSLGAVFHTPIIHIESIVMLEKWFLELKKEINISIIGSDSSGSISLKDCELKKPLILILGNEAKGMSIRLKVISDYIVKIPLTGEVNSLNVACAGSILMFSVNN